MNNKKVNPFLNFIKLLFLAQLFCIGLISCEDFFETNIEIDPPEVVNKIIVNAYIEAGQEELKIYTGRNLGLGESINSLSTFINSSLTIENLETATTLNIPNLGGYNTGGRVHNHYINGYDPDFFSSDANLNFKISEPSGDYPEIDVNAKFPSKTILKEVVFEYDGGIREDGDEASSINITFDDPPNEKNFYELAIVRDRRISEYASTIDLSASKGAENDFLLISDESFDGQEKTLEVKIYRNSSEKEDYYTLEWRDITEDYYKYSKTLDANEDASRNPFTAFGPVYTNVENGAGIISLYHEQIVELD